jgi:hypothetical protein
MYASLHSFEIILLFIGYEIEFVCLVGHLPQPENISSTVANMHVSGPDYGEQDRVELCSNSLYV